VPAVPHLNFPSIANRGSISYPISVSSSWANDWLWYRARSHFPVVRLLVCVASGDLAETGRYFLLAQALSLIQFQLKKPDILLSGVHVTFNDTALSGRPDK
jgi:hypothetical protein